MNYPILEFDETRRAVIEPTEIIKPQEGMPEYCVFCFFQKVIQSVCKDAEIIGHTGSEIGNNPIYVIEHNGKKIAVTHPGVGAPLAVSFVEELIAMGSTKFIAAGGAGVLNKEIAVGHVIIPNAAIRDEGTSYHYLPPSREVAANPKAVTAIEATLKAHDVPYIIGKTWTTDGVYRETPGKIARRREEGCVTVEMETAAFFAVAEFRDVTFGQLLYGGDDVSGEGWDTRDWHKQASTREKLFWLAVESVVRL